MSTLTGMFNYNSGSFAKAALKSLLALVYISICRFWNNHDNIYIDQQEIGNKNLKSREIMMLCLC